MGRRPIPAPGPPIRPPAPVDPATAGGPTLAVHFLLSIDGSDLAVARVSGLALAADPAALKQTAPREPGQPPGWAAPALPTRLALVRAVDGDRTLFGWRREAADGKPALRDVGLRQLDRPGGETLNAWALTGCWPLAWRGPEFDALDGGVALETLEIVCHDLRWL